MKIAVTSQNRKAVTEHAGRCRKFWLYTVNNRQIVDKSLLELSKEQSFHDSSPQDEHPLDGIDVLITAGAGTGLSQRLGKKGIHLFITDETEPDTAIQRFLDTDH
ncbi:NifB/NifX family molybdenum-iron cluster-binding protein [Marinobacterium weihaiense]|uniref:Dinitrogenase iron-molybdenum cofactor biosynthesis domain-containing protein n=1 Tax=Marinobacterium weihaiense TaxID=2851016 RepID=A0ABS6MEY9_9GAMM|nr:NifB/NifX family molybdenum-iron cluster-binding protein [Marinobacterium weihaiense]MBV0934859.1 hypothetical protein [Marinobacterium weihaiense]